MSRVNKKRSNAELAKAWIFPWRRTFRRRWTMLLGALLVLPIMAIMLTTVRVRVFPMPPSLNRTGDLVMVPDTAENRDWLEKIAQKTPFPAIGENRAIEALADQALLQHVRAPYQTPALLRDVILPPRKPVFDETLILPPLALGEAITATTPTQSKRLQPRLRLLGSLTNADLPSEWPTFLGTIDATSGQKFLLEINDRGRVIDCISLPQETATRQVALENWLKQLNFPVTKKRSGWIGCEIIWEHHD